VDGVLLEEMTPPMEVEERHLEPDEDH